VTVARILSLIDCPSLTQEFRDELLTLYRLTPEEAGAVARLVEAWGWEKNNRMSPRERRVEIRARIVAYLEASRTPNHYECHRCQVRMASVFYADAHGNEVCKKCFDEVHPAPRCEHCGFECPMTDALPTAAGGKAHARCAARLTNAYGYQAAAKMNALGLGVMKGGKGSVQQ
jgi:hypothetical protein